MAEMDIGGYVPKKRSIFNWTVCWHIVVVCIIIYLTLAAYLYKKERDEYRRMCDYWEAECDTLYQLWVKALFDEQNIIEKKEE